MQLVVRVLGAVLVLSGGAVHLDLWRGGYEGIPYIGQLFLANVVVSVVVAVALVVRGGTLVLAAGLALAVGSLAALVTSRTVGLLGFMEAGWTEDAMRTVAAETGTLVTLGLLAVMGHYRDDPDLIPVPVR